MSTSEAAPRSGRETRLLLVTIAVSIGVLLLLARFRFPDAPVGQPAESVPAPLERLAARAAYDELASIMADLERRIAPRVAIIRTQSPDGPVSLAVAPRLTPDRVVTLLGAGESIVGATSGAPPEVISRDPARGLAVLRVPAVDDSAVTIRPGTPRPGPRYVGVLEAAAGGPALRPVYVGRIDSYQDPPTGMQLLSLTGVQHALPRGAAVFSLEGAFIGLVRDTGDTTVLVAAETLRTAAQEAQQSAAPPNGDLGVEVDVLTAALARATGTDKGVIVAHVDPSGPAAGVLRSGDVLQSVDGAPVTSVTGFRDLERTRAPGAGVTITGVRGASPLQVSIRAGDRAEPATHAADGPGFVGQNVAGAGIEVVTVEEGSAAARAGLQRGDLIEAINGEQARDTAAMARWFRSAAAGSAILITVQRGREHRVLVLEKR